MGCCGTRVGASATMPQVVLIMQNVTANGPTGCWRLSNLLAFRVSFVRWRRERKIMAWTYWFIVNSHFEMQMRTMRVSRRSNRSEYGSLAYHRAAASGLGDHCQVGIARHLSARAADVDHVPVVEKPTSIRHPATKRCAHGDP